MFFPKFFDRDSFYVIDLCCTKAHKNKVIDTLPVRIIEK